MCPDDEIVSLFFDGELPSPWKEKMDAHLSVCGKCRIRLERYRGLRTVLEEDRIEVPAALKNRVWDAVISKTPKESRDFSPTRKAAYPGLWNRSVSLPFPAAAAAVAAFIIFAFLAVQGFQSPQSSGALGGSIAAGIGTDVQGIVPVSDMNDVLQYLSGEEMADFTTIHLPETRNFSSSGEPALLKAADYSRRNSPR